MNCPQEGKRDGIGVKRYADGSTFDGFWKEGKKHGVGVFRPAQVCNIVGSPQNACGLAILGEKHAVLARRRTPSCVRALSLSQ